MGRLLISLVIALALVIVVWNLLRDGSDEGVDAGEEAVAASPVDDGAEPEGRDPVGIDLPADPEPEQPSSAPEPAEATGAERVAVAVDPTTEVAERPEDGFVVRVVVAETGEPAPGARVRYVEQDSVDVEGLQMAFLEGAQMADLLERFGTLYLADEQGELRLPEFDEFGVVSARHGELFGLLQLSHGEDEPFVLELQPQEHVRVRVVDAAGAPQAGVPVVLRVKDGRWSNDMLGIETRDPDGIAELRNIDQLLAQGMPPYGPAELRNIYQLLARGIPPDGLYVAIGGLLAEPAEVPLDSEAMPVEPVELVLPPTGRVEVRVVDGQGEPLAEEDSFAVLAKVPEGWDKPVRRLLGTQPERLEGGRVLFPHVGLGLRLQASVGSMDGGDPAAAIAYGPMAAGELVVIEVVDNVADTVVLGRLLDGENEPLANSRVQYKLKHERVSSTSSRGSSFTTDGEGRFEVTIPTESQGDWEARTLDLTYAPVDTQQRYEAPIDLSYPLRPGENDLGDIALVLPPLLVSGVVVDEAGEPLKGVEISFEALQISGDEDPFDPDAHTWWRGLWELNARSDRDGYFEVRGTSDSPRLRLSCQSREHYHQEPIEFQAGTTGLRVVLRAAGGIAGSVLVDEGVPHQNINLVRSTDDEDDSESTWLDEDAEFSWPAIPPGTYGVAVVLDSEEEPLVLVEGVHVVAGEQDGGFHGHACPEFDFDESGEAVGTVGRPGSYWVHLWAWCHEGGRMTVTGVGGTQVEIEVLDAESEQLFSLDVSQEAVDEALD